jgi:hypothetical protein
MKKDRFYIATQLQDDEAYKEALQKAIELCNDKIKRIVLLINSKNAAQYDRILSAAEIKGLFKGTSVPGRDAIIQFVTLNAYRESYRPEEIVISCAIDSEDLLKIDSYHCVVAIIAIPWTTASMDKWVKTWNPIDIRTGSPSPEKYPEPTKVVKTALRELTSSINMSTGIHHPGDNDSAKTMILALHKYEDSLDPDVVRSFLCRELDWTTDHSKDVEKLISTLNQGKHFQGGRRTGLKNEYKRWKEAV